jgi:hypothetical protein
MKMRTNEHRERVERRAKDWDSALAVLMAAVSSRGKAVEYLKSCDASLLSDARDAYEKTGELWESSLRAVKAAEALYFSEL